MAACLLLFSTFGAGLHRWHHAIEHASPGAGCAHCAVADHGRRSAATANDPVVRLDHLCADDCALCAVLAHGHVWGGGSIDDVAAREPPMLHSAPSSGGLCASIALLRLPPARGPPFLLS